MPTLDDHNGETRSPRGMRPLVIATAVSVSGDGALRTAAPLLAASLTDNPAAVATVTAAIYLPWLLVGLPAGALVDRWPKRRVVISANVFQAGTLGLFCLLLVSGRFTLLGLVITVLLINAAESFFTPAAQSVIPAIVGRDEDMLRRANGRYTSAETLGRAMIGPLGGAWLFTVGRVVPFLADAVSFLISAVFLTRLPPVPPASGPREPILTAVRTGFRQVYRSRELFVITLGLVVYNLGYFAAIAPFALYTRDVLHVGEIAYGVLFAVLGAAGITTGWFGTGLLSGVSAGRIMTVILAAPGLAWLVAAAFPSFWITIALFVCVGATAMLISVIVNAACQRLAPDGTIGRISSIVRFCGIGANGIGALIGGWLASGWGLSAPLILAGAVQLAAAIAVWIFVGRSG